MERKSNAKARGDEQKPDMRCGTLGTSGHVTSEVLHSPNRVCRLIRRYLQAGMLTGNVYVPRSEGTPQGSPLSPLLANLLLDQLDQELEKRGHCFGRYADDVSIYVKSKRSGRRVLQSIDNYLPRN